MKKFCYLLLFALALGFTFPAKAYRINVLDPISTNKIYTEPFNVSLVACTAAELPYSNSPGTHGCFSGENDTPNILTTLEVVFPNLGILAGSSLQCSKTNVSIFNASSCGVYSNYQIFFFSGLHINIGQAFLIVEEGINPGTNPENPLFPGGVGSSPTVLTVPNPVPEPTSIVLLSTALILGGFFFARRQILLPFSAGFRASGN